MARDSKKRDDDPMIKRPIFDGDPHAQFVTFLCYRRRRLGVAFGAVL